MPDYIPSSDEHFDAWLQNFQTYVIAHQDHFSFLPADTDPLNAACTLWNGSFAAHNAAVLAAKSARSTKDNDRTDVTAIARSLVRRIQANPNTTDADRQALQITVPGSLAEAGADLPADDKPMATIDISNRLKHVFKIQNQTLSGVKSGKPAGALGAEIWRKIGDAPASEAELMMVGIATRSQFVIEYPMEEGGKQVNYMMRWVNTKGEAGSWSETQSVTIAA